MANHFRLYERPLMADETEAALTVTGVLEGYTSGEAYESRLQINNSIGRCTVEIVEANLPPGAAVRVDNVTKEVVVKWDAFEVVAEELNAVPNGDFEEGDNGQWAFGNGWSIEAGGAETGTFSGVFQNFKGISSIESVRLPYTPGTPIKGQCRFQQGASSKGNLVGRALLIWCDANGNMLPGGEGVSFTGGDLIRSGSNGEWKTSTVTGASREATMVAIGFNCNRKKQNKLARVDNFTWNHKYTLGQVGDDVYFLHIKVTDSLNRVAYWKGNIEEYGVFLTSQLYPFYVVEELQTAPSYTEWRDRSSPNQLESVVSTPSFVEFGFKSVRRDYDAGAESVLTTPSFVSMEIRTIRRDYDAGYESVLTTPSLVSFNIKEHPKPPTEVDSVLTTPSFVSWSTS
ncbi:hypothetical protein IVIADoCa2_47 [Xanthomonas phage vB_Xar_IVIA-DoCa2]|uniref:Tail fiber protein n=1 Tax=Xanthomonas phage vB_Xar_IVIA-DoCa2 TaxID=2970491 RepID=A0A976SHC0_9CAUD|nr:hypothetical protein IVIADoCa2_47 [Xanthomonas phage vB_Xar_IVIA-DoCa2]